MDYEALAKKYGGSSSPIASDPYEELAKKYGGSYAAAKPTTKEPEEGIISSAIGGGKRLLSSIQTAGESIFDAEEAARRGAERSQQLGRQYAPGASLEAVKKVYEEKGIIPAAGEAISQIPSALAEQSSNIAAMLAAGKAGAMAGTAVAPGVGTVVGGALGAATPALLQLFGSGLERQAEEGADISRGRALAAAAPGAALEVAGPAVALGRGLIAKILGPEARKILATGNREAAEALAKESLKKSIAKGTVVGAAAEIPTEVTQQMLERWQAGLPLTDDQALAEYGEAAYGAGLVGGPFGAVGRVGQRAVAKSEEKERTAQDQIDKQTRLQILEEKAKGTEDRTVTTPEGKEVTIPGKLPEYLTDQEKAERDMLRADLGVSVPDVSTYSTVNKRGQDITVEVTNNPDGSVTAKSSDGKEFDLSQMLDRGMSVEEAINTTFARKNAKPATLAEPEGKVAEEPKIEEEVIEPPKTEAPAAIAPEAEPSLETQIPEAAEPTTPEARSEPKPAAEAPAEEVIETAPPKVATEIESLDQAQTGQPLSYQGFRGAGKTAEEIYSGAKVPVAGPGRYIAISREDASTFGDEITEEPVTLNNPLVIRTDDEWRALTRRAGWKFPNPFGLDEDTVRKYTDNLAKIVTLEDGHDGLVIDPSKDGDAAKTLNNVFGIPQIVDYSGLLKPQAKPQAETTAVQISAEDQKRDALNHLSSVLDNTVPAFRAKNPNGRVSRISPKPLPSAQKKLIIQLFGDAIDLGFPASLLYKVTAGGVTGMDCSAAISAQNGWLLLGKDWKTLTNAERLSTLVHEIGHVVDYKSEQNIQSISLSKEWETPHSELKQWYDRDSTAKNPLSYPFSKTFKKSIPDTRAESLAQAFSLYFTDPVGLQTNAPSAYSAIQSIVERIQNEPTRTKAAGAPAAETTGVEIREARAGKGPEIQPGIGEVGPAVGRVERIKDRGAGLKTVPISPSIKEKQPPVQRSQAGQAAMQTVESMGRQPKVTQNTLEKANSIFKDALQNPQVTKEAAKTATTRWLDKMGNRLFSPDEALNNAIRRAIDDTTMSNQEKIGVLLSISSNQAVHADALASQFISLGNIKYDPTLYKYEASDSKYNYVALSKAIDEIVKKHGLNREEAERVGHLYFEANRLDGVMRFNERIDAEVFEAQDRLQKAIDDGDENAEKVAEQDLRKATGKYKYVNMTREEIDAGVELATTIPELKKVAEIWNGIRGNAAKVLVDSGLWSEQEAESLLSVIEYVPMYREDQLEKNMGPKEFLRGLEVQAKEKRFKGSNLPVADIFDNMVRWTQYAIKRSVMNNLANAKIDAAVEFGFAREVPEGKKGPNSVRTWKNGKATFYDMDDPLFMEAFAGTESVSLPIWKFFASISNFLRQSVVLNPLFSVAQVPQDAFAAMFSSGLKTRYALSIPARAVKEFITTLNKSSKTHEQLKRFGAVGVKDYSSAIARIDAEVQTGLKKTPGILNKTKALLEHISMASDNAIRQAVYSASIDQGLSQAEALEKAFAIINFKNRGNSPTIRMLAQVVPFFNAYLAAQHVAIKTVSGVGISPSVRSDALKTLATTTASVMTLSLLYAMAMDDDEEYKDKPSVMRDRLFIIPGLGMTIPIRTDIFSMPKILTEHMYMLMTDQGMADGRKFRDSMKAALGNILLGPTPVPQAIKPVVEVAVNYNFFQGRPLVGTYQKGLEVERQFNDTTSVLAKLFGQTGLVSPIAADHVFRGTTGSLGGLIIFLTNPILHNAMDTPRPEMSLREMAAALPGTGAFVSRPYETGLKNDFYVLRDEVSKAVNTFNDLKRRSPMDVEEYLANEDKVTRIGMQKAVNQITENLSNIRKRISLINNLPGSEMSPAEKKSEIDQLKEAEQTMLRNVDIKELRRIANL